MPVINEKIKIINEEFEIYDLELNDTQSIQIKESLVLVLIQKVM